MISVYQFMLNELESSFPETVKVPTLDGGYIRVAVNVNAEWYRNFCSRYLTCYRRRPKLRTMIRRCHVTAALRRMIAGKCHGVYAERLKNFADDWLIPELTARDFFKGKRA